MDSTQDSTPWIPDFELLDSEFFESGTRIPDSNC